MKRRITYLEKLQQNMKKINHLQFVSSSSLLRKLDSLSKKRSFQHSYSTTCLKATNCKNRKTSDNWLRNEKNIFGFISTTTYHFQRNFKRLTNVSNIIPFYFLDPPSLPHVYLWLILLAWTSQSHLLFGGNDQIFFWIKRFAKTDHSEIFLAKKQQ